MVFAVDLMKYVHMSICKYTLVVEVTHMILHQSPKRAKNIISLFSFIRGRAYVFLLSGGPIDSPVGFFVTYNVCLKDILI